MRRAVLICCTIAATLVPLATAGAKGVSQVAVCGAQGCKDVTGRAADSDVAFPIGAKTEPPSSSAPFVRVVAVISEPPGTDGGTEMEIARSSYLYFPSLHLIRTQGRTQGGTGPQMKARWQHADALLVENLGEMLDGVRRFPAARLDRIRHSPPVKLPEKLGSRPTVATTSEVATPPAPVKDTRDSGGFPWWALVAGLAVAAAGAALMRRRGPTEPHAT